MAKSLAELRAAPPTERWKDVVRVCLRPDLPARIQLLTSELAELPEPEAPEGPPRKMGQVPTIPDPHPREAEIQAELAALVEEMAEYEGDVGLEGKWTEGEWRQWVDAHPPRAEGEPGHRRDMRLTGGLLNTDALIAELDTFAVDWNGEPLGEGDWASIFGSVSTGDKAEMVRRVFKGYEGTTDFRPWRAALSAGLKRYSDYVSPGPSASAASDSTGGSPAPSSEATTETATASD